jgi:hypothetical protein
MKAKNTQGREIHARRRILAGTLAVGALSLATAGCGFPAASAVSGASGGTAIVECRSGVVTDGEIRTSSMSVTKVDATQVPELPEGCSVTP